jgi:hypothetical protein
LNSDAPYSTAPSPPYYLAYDTANPDIQLPIFGNISADDCVIAARAHHTIRLTYAPGQTPLAITDSEVTTEFNNETSQQGTNGLILETSLDQWLCQGWTAGGVPHRMIAGRWGPYGVVEAANSANQTNNDMDEIQVMNAIYQYTGAQVDIRLPEWIDPAQSSTIGGDTVWSDTSYPPSDAHVMLLIGYDQNGPIGVTWGERQHMTWGFLARYCTCSGDGTGLWVVASGDHT